MSNPNNLIVPQKRSFAHVEHKKGHMEPGSEGGSNCKKCGDRNLEFESEDVIIDRVSFVEQISGHLDVVCRYLRDAYEELLCGDPDKERRKSLYGYVNMLHSQQTFLCSIALRFDTASQATGMYDTEHQWDGTLFWISCRF